MKNKFPVWTLVSAVLTVASLFTSYKARSEGAEATREIVREELDRREQEAEESSES